MNIKEQTSDEDIIKAVREGDKDAFVHILNRYESKIKAYINRITTYSPEADDLVQQTFINVYVNLNSFDLGKKLSSWIYRIAHNLSINWLKKKKAGISLDENEFIANQLKDDIDLNQEVIDKETARLLRDSINRLPKKFKEPFMLKYFEEMSYQEISYVLRLPKNTVGTFINRAKKILKKDLYKEYVERK